MLRRLSVSNLAVVDDAVLELGPGLNVVTGETGAGKSLILGAVGLLTGDRAASGLVRKGTGAARLEAVFEPRDPSALDARLETHGLPLLEDGYLMLRRELTPDGRSRAFVGDTQVRLATLRAIGADIVDIHGQAEGHALLTPSRQRDVLDEAANALALRAELRAILEKERAVGRAIEEAHARREEIARQREFFEHQLREIDAAELIENEAEALKGERKLYLDAERIVDDTDQALRELSDDDGGAIDRLSRAAALLGRLAERDARWAPAQELAESGRIAAEEADRSVRDARGSLDFSAARRDEVEQRLDVITRLERKYARTVTDLLALATQIREALAGDEERGRATDALEQDRDALRREASRVADALSAARTAAAGKLARAVGKELPELGMKGARIEVHLEAVHDPVGWHLRGKTPVALGPEGAERVDFRLAANPGQEAGSLSRVASGGELSRVVLALKACLAGSIGTDVMIFDEIDAGVGGRTARAVAERMREIARGRQVIAITHLAPVACAAAQHHVIEKTSARGATRVRVKQLEAAERVDEVTRMLSGGEGDDAARAHAKELLAAMAEKTPRAGARRTGGERVGKRT